MSKQWNKDIHDRLKDFPKRAPEGLLDDIKSEMFRRNLSNVPSTNKPNRTHPIFRAASVAAIITLLFGIGYLFQKKEPTCLPNEMERSIRPIENETISASEDIPENQPILFVPSPSFVVKAEKTTTVLPDTPSIDEEILSDQTNEEKGTKETKEEQTSEFPSKPKPSPQKAWWTAVVSRKKNTSFNMSIYYSGIIAQINPSIRHYNIEAIKGKPSMDTNHNDSTNVYCRGFSRATNQEFNRHKNNEKAKHHLPIRLGVSFRYHIDKRWSIQSGVTYSYLASDLSYNGWDTSYQTDQTLHYIGIPFQVGLRIWESQQFRTYISAGGQVEKLINGKATTHYTTSKQEQGTLIEDINDKKLLFSTMASIGAEFSLSESLSLYAEPGFHYYFKNGNGLKTHYNEQPLNFNITIGFRFHWNR